MLWHFADDGAKTRIGEANGTHTAHPQMGGCHVKFSAQPKGCYRTFTWDPQRFADPGQLSANLDENGFKLVTIADPGIKIDPGWDVYDTGIEGDHFLRNPSGELYEGFVWPGPSLFPDFTRAQTRAWWGAHVARQLDLGVRGIWLDVNEPTNFPEAGGATVPGDVPVDGDGIATTDV